MTTLSQSVSIMKFGEMSARTEEVSLELLFDDVLQEVGRVADAVAEVRQDPQEVRHALRLGWARSSNMT